MEGLVSPPSAEVAPESELLPLPRLLISHTQLWATDSPGLMEWGEKDHTIFSSLASWGLLDLVPPELGICCGQLGKDLLQLRPIFWKSLTEGSDETSS